MKDESLMINSAISEQEEINLNCSITSKSTSEYWFLFENMEGFDLNIDSNLRRSKTCLGRIRPCSDYKSLVKTISNRVTKQFTQLSYEYEEFKIEINESQESYEDFLEYFTELSFNNMKKQKKIFLTFQIEERKCFLHPQYSLDLVCQDCEEIVCFNCILEKHENHSKKGWTDFLKSFNQSNGEINFDLFEKLTNKNIYLENLLSNMKSNRENVEINYIEFCKDLENVRKIFDMKINEILKGADFLKNQKINLIVNSLDDLKSKFNQIDSIGKKLNIKEQNFEFLLIISEAKKLLKFDYDGLLNLQEWKYSLDIQSITEFIDTLQLSELKFFEKNTKIYLDNMEFAQELMTFRKIYVNEIINLEIKTFNSNNHITINGVESVKILNFTNGKTYEIHKKIDSDSFVGQIAFDEKRKFTIYPIINDKVLFHLKREIEIETKFCIANTKVYGIKESIQNNSNINILIEAFDSQENRIYYGGEKFKVSYYNSNNIEDKFNLKYFDNKDGNYHAYGNISHPGDLKLSIEILQKNNDNNDIWVHLPYSPFGFECLDLSNIQNLKNLGVSKDYVPEWKVWEGLRELLQNWRDGLIEGLNIRIHQANFLKTETPNEIKYSVTYQNNSLGFLSYLKNENKLILNNNGKISRDCLALGNSKKRNDPNASGHFGEGMKLAALSLLRENKSLVINTGNETWKFSIQLDELYSIFMLFVKIENNIQENNITDAIIQNITLGEFEDMMKKLIFFRQFNSMSESGQILFDPNEKGNIYVKGIFLLKNNFFLGYNLNQLKLDRDRKLIADQNEFKKNVHNTIFENVQSNCLEKLYNFLLALNAKSILSSSEFYHIYNDNQKYPLFTKKLADEFIKRNPNGIPRYTGNNDYLDRFIVNYLPGKMKIIIPYILDYFINSHVGPYNMYINYCKRNFNRNWYENLNTSEINIIRNTINSLENLGFTIKQQYKDMNKYKKGLPPLYSENECVDFFSNTTGFIIINNRLFNNPSIKLGYLIHYLT